MVVDNALKPLPGPKNFFGLKNLRDLSQEGMRDFISHCWQEYGDIFEVQVGPKKLVMIIHPDHVRHITLTNAQNYEKLESYDPVRKYIIGDGIVTSTGDLWKRQRRLMSPFYTPRGVQEFADIFLRDTLAMTERWESLAANHSQVEMFDEMALITASIVLKAIFSTESDQDILEVKEWVETMIGFAGSGTSNPFRLPDWVPTETNINFRKARNNVHEYINKVLDARLAMDEAEYPNDLLSKLITAEDPETGERMSRDLLRDEALTNFFAGYETSARSMSHAWYALAQNPDVKAKLHEELDRELGDDIPTLETLKRLPYTLRVIKEALRLYPPAPMYAKDVINDDVIDGYHIEKDSVMMLLPYFTHRHPDFWEDPLRFEPNRHAPEAEKARHSQAYHPFASGQRVCLGNHFSLLETHIILAILAQRFDPQLLPDYQANFVMEGLLEISNGLPMILEKR
ncbi:cytochrome P450 [Phototrophicus methaneseepsis]|uniref:Cytochrome P450 n=1 Tax=Phototrophicus methaneseepsis TaxID=2710758 RepID=A0A7S8IBK1_9CHLR|nr:cytochrome P450 [Phototrophicus methaneseepsis]